jgi:TolA-binding protein
LLLGGAALWWHDHKSDLREEGRQECVQEINRATVDALEQQLENKNAAIEELRRLHADALIVAEERKQRELEAMDRLELLESEMEDQRNADPEYREWSDTDLPDGVADRLREAAGSSSGSGD